MARPIIPPTSTPDDDPDPGKRLRQAREAAALRDNLHRRKQQTRARAQAAPTEPAADPDLAAAPEPPD